jgi:periplasmic divalent cation tolerance protein
MSKFVVGMVTCSSRAEGRNLAKRVLSKKLAACVNILGGVESHYWWQGKMEQSGECLLLIKTTRAQTSAVTRAIKSAHSYKVPEVVFLPIAQGERNYLNWIRKSVKKPAVVALLALCATTVRADHFDDLVRQLGSTNDEERVEAADQLAAVGGSRAKEQFRKMIKSDNPEQRQMAVVGLLQVSGADEDVERIRARLKDDNSTVRWSAAVALGQSGRVEAVPWLQDAAKSDESDSVKEAAHEAAEKLQLMPHWAETLPDAFKQARALNKPVLAYFFVRNSDFCRKLEEGLFSDRAVLDEAEKFVCARVNAGEDTDTARKFDVRGAPTILFLDGEGNEMSRITGLVDKSALMAKLEEARRSKLTFREAHRLALKDPTDVQANWRVAETYLEEGREDLAEPHLRNVVEHDENNQYGFTDDAMFALGFALGKRGQYAQAVYAFEHVVEKWPGFKDKDKALYCLGLSALAMGQKEKGRAALEQLVREFPNSGTVKSAQQALDKLGNKNEKIDQGK